VTGLVWVKAQVDLTSDEVEIRRANARAIAMMSQLPGAPARYFVQPYDTITFFPEPDAAYTYSVNLALRPTYAATAIDSDVFTKYRMGIAHGILADLLAGNGKPWSNPSLASYHLGEYLRAIRDAKLELNREFTGESLMVELQGGA
jgi:hypothetical protein